MFFDAAQALHIPVHLSRHLLRDPSACAKPEFKVSGTFPIAQKIDK
jgi:hypothetical protein